MPIRRFVSKLGLPYLRQSNILVLQLTFWPELAHTIRVADVEAIKVGRVSCPSSLIVADEYSQNIVNKRFPKPTELLESTDIYGKHIISTDGDMWKKYRRISSPSFSEVSLSASPPLTQCLTIVSRKTIN